MKTTYKTILLGLLLVLSAIVVSGDTGCCLNPLADQFFCNTAGSGTVSDSYCCPSPETTYTDYYYNSYYEYGPTDYNDCTSDDYFKSGSSCSVQTGCEIICCCNLPDEIDATEIARVACLDMGGNIVNDDVCSQGGVCEVPTGTGQGEDCSDPFTSPQIEDVEVFPVRGEKEMQLQWSDDCTATSYRITRCEIGDSSCDTIIGYATERSYTDDSADLKWGVNYQYKIEATYPNQGFISDNRKYTGNLGDIECWSKYTNDAFCLHTKDYLKQEIKNYLIANTNTITSSNYLSQIDTLYSDKLNDAFRCNQFNKLSTPPLKSCEVGEMCIIDQGSPDCVLPSSCEPEDIFANPFGAYLSEQDCYGLGYCHYDNSYSKINDKCYGCNDWMFCYDYKSEETCQTDICGAGIGNCVWKDIIPELGVGVCVDSDQDNCEWCDDKASSLVKEPAHNNVLVSCNEYKAEALSVPNYECYYTNGEALSCNDISCRNLESCFTTSITLNNDNSIVERGEVCNLDVCRSYLDGCWKDANADGVEDCKGQTNEEGCENDLFIPDTYLSEIDDEGVVVGYDIVITDQNAVGTIYNALGYTTKLCIDGVSGHTIRLDSISVDTQTGQTVTFLVDGVESDDLQIGETQDYSNYILKLDSITDTGTYWNVNVCVRSYSSNPSMCDDYVSLPIGLTQETKTFIVFDPTLTLCSVTPGVDFPLSTQDNKLSINGLLLGDGNNDRPITMLNEGINTIYYYSIDPSSNLGIVKSVQVEAHAGNARPDLYRVTVGGKDEEDGEFYTNKRNPSIKLYFRSPGAKLTDFKVTDSSNNEILDLGDYGVTSNDYDVTEYTLDFPQNILLDTGRYEIYVNAINQENRPMRQIFRKKYFNVDYGLFDLDIIVRPVTQWNNQEVANTSMVNVLITSPRVITLTDVSINGQDYLDEFSDQAGTSFSATLNLSDGSKTIIAQGEDVYDNIGSGSKPFIINAESPLTDELELISPSYGVSGVEEFDLILFSNNDLYCKYTLDNPVYINSDFDFMDEFDSTNSRYHIERNMTISDTNEHTLYVWCKDEYWREQPYRFEFDLMVDLTAPLIQQLYTLPKNPVAELPVTLMLTAEANEEVKCKYSENDNTQYSNMIDFFDYDDWDFKTKKDAYIDLTTQGTKTYYVMCENRAGLRSTESSIAIDVDLSIPLRITDHTERYQGGSNPVMAIETNKQSSCRYSFIDSQVRTGSRLGSTNSYDHTATLSVNLSSQTYNVYVRCFRPGESVISTVTFTIDVTPPEMEYINDTSLFVGYPELTGYSNRIYVEWYAFDNETGEEGISYNYSLIEASTNDYIINWTSADDLDIDDNEFEGWIDEDHNGDDLNLSDNTRYIFQVQPGNIVGLWGDEEESDGVRTAFSIININGTCTNGVRDGRETDIDCGGNCEKCEVNKKCDKDYDCITTYCSENERCEFPRCNDDVENGNETDEDCGGDECDECSEGDSCKKDDDCQDNLDCRYGKCQKPDACQDHKLSSGEADVDCGGVCPNKCERGQYCNDDDDCSNGLECDSGVCKTEESDGDLDSDGDGMPDSWEIRYGLDPNDPSDADLDIDNDGLSNYDEYVYGTDPNDKDTDGDSYNDGDEIDAGTDPRDADDYPRGMSWWKWLLLILLIIILILAILYLLYLQKNKNDKDDVKPMPMPVRRPMPPKRKPMPIRRRPVKKVDKSSIFDKFEDDKPKEEPKKTKETVVEESVSVSEVKTKKDDDVFKKLSTLASQAKKEEKEEKQEEVKPVKKETKIVVKDKSKKINSRLDKVEKKLESISKPSNVFSTKTGTRYHKANCITLKGKKGIKKFTNKKDAEKKKMKPCSVCMSKK